ncbi:MAG: hypothetical protein WBW71_09725 [Bacteroidota bacterium]
METRFTDQELAQYVDSLVTNKQDQLREEIPRQVESILGVGWRLRKCWSWLGKSGKMTA